MINVWEVCSNYFQTLFSKVNKLNSTRSQTSIQVALDFIKIETRASGSVCIQGIQDVRKLIGANIVIVEDIVDTGRTMVKVEIAKKFVHQS